MDIRLLTEDDLELLQNATDEVFDLPVQKSLCAEFLNDPRHHIAAAMASGKIIGMASGVHYVHPDKPPELWINEVGVADHYQRQGIGKQLMQVLFAKGKELGCTNAWVGTDTDNAAAHKLYESVGGRKEPFVVFDFDL